MSDGPYTYDRIAAGLHYRRVVALAQTVFGDTACATCLHRSDYHVHRRGKDQCVSCNCPGYIPPPEPWEPIR